MKNWFRTHFWVSAVTIGSLGPITTLQGQTLRGRVVDADTESGVAGAVVVVAAGQRPVLTTLTDSLGSFVLQLPETGAFSVHAERIGYLRSNAATIEMSLGDDVHMQISLESNVLPIDEVVVTGLRGGRLPSAATIDGLHARRAILPRVGSRRVFVHDDPELRNVATVGQLLERWIPFGGERRCVDWFVNGLPMHPLTQPREFVREMATSMLEGIEYYREDLTAPLDFHGQGWCRQMVGGTYSIIAVWFKR